MFSTSHPGPFALDLSRATLGVAALAAALALGCSSSSSGGDPAADGGADTGASPDDDAAAATDTGSSPFVDTPLSQCLLQACPDPMSECATSPGCLEGFNCAFGCDPNDMGCVNDCLSSAKASATSVEPYVTGVQDCVASVGMGCFGG